MSCANLRQMPGLDRIVCTAMALFACTLSVERASGEESERAGRASPRVSVDLADNVALSHLERFDALRANGQWKEAVDILRQVMDTAGGKVIAASSSTQEGEFLRYVPLRRHCQQELVELSRSTPEALTLYRDQADPIAKRLLEQGTQNRDDFALQQLVDRHFASSYGDDALMRRGELAFERGDWTMARSHWERISAVSRFPVHNDATLGELAGYPLWLVTRQFKQASSWRELETLLHSGAENPNWLVYPDTDFDVAELQARLVLISIIEGDRPRARRELEWMRRKWPHAAGRIGSDRGAYVELLNSLLDKSKDWPPLPISDSWTSFAGDARRAGVARRGIDVAGAPRWHLKLPRYTSEGEYYSEENRRVAESAQGLLSYHPVVLNGTVVLQTGFRSEEIIACRLHDGEVIFGETHSHREAGRVADELLPQQLRVAGVPRFTLSVFDDTLYARIGSPITGTRDANHNAGGARIVAIDLNAEGKLLSQLETLESVWGPDWSFDGVPVSDGKFLYVVLRKQGTVRAEVHVACFEPQSGRLRWRRMIAAAETPSDRTFDITHTLLTLRHETIYCNTNLGAVAALRKDDGRVRWITEYPRVALQNENPDRNTQHYFRDLNPCLLHNDFVFVAPRDCDRIFALDAVTGGKLWSTRAEQAADAIHLLGVGQGNLIASGDYLYWFDVHSGRLVGQFPGPRKAGPGFAKPTPQGYGRGILAGKHVYWPTTESIFVFEQRTSNTPHRREPRLVRKIRLTPRGATGGNLVLRDGVLLIATPDKLFAFDEYGRYSRTTE